MSNPYEKQSPVHFWKTGVADLDPGMVKPFPAKTFTMKQGAPIGTAGSCFAQEVGKYLLATSDATLLVTEPGAADQPLFSALYGNVYTTRQLLQLFDRAFGRLVAADTAWQRHDGKYVDPFRPYMFRAGFATAADVAAARAAHLDAVRRVFQESSVFIFTLGLTESWRAKADGAVFPVAPGVVSETVDADNYAFHNFSYAEVLEDCQQFIERLRDVNPAVRVILTVSPVPLTATYTAEHVLVATARSKAILRAVCAEMEARHDFIYYFPSYEIVSGHYNRGRYYDANLRTVTREGVAHVMTVFYETYFNRPTEYTRKASGRVPEPHEDDSDTPICDEQEIVRSIGFD